MVIGATTALSRTLHIADTLLPLVVRIRQRRPDRSLADPAACVASSFIASGLSTRIPRGPVAIGVGSRGIANIAAIVGATVAAVGAAGGEPFIVPAMGSHGASTAQGQVEVLAGYGITPASMGCPVRATMETVVVAHTANGLPVYMDAFAASAQGIIVVSRVKPHTAFRAPIESGMAKMLAIGLGKLDGPTVLHAAGLADSIPLVAGAAMAARPVLGGVAIVEDAHERTLHVEAVTASDLLDADRRLLKVAAEQLLRVPLAELDVLIVDRMGKDISGSGMDYNVTGMWRRLGGERVPNYRRIVVLGLSTGAHGNALGVGAADFTTQRLVDAIDYDAMIANALTAQTPEAVRVPVTLPTDELAIKAAVRAAPIPIGDGREVRLAHIDSTLILDELEVSAALLPELLAADDRIEQVSDAFPLQFTADGRLAGVRAQGHHNGRS